MFLIFEPEIAFFWSEILEIYYLSAGLRRIFPQYIFLAVSFFMTCEIELNTKNSTRRQQSCLGWVFGVQLGLRQAQAMIKMKTIRRGKVPPAILLLSSKLLLSSNEAGGTFPLHIVFVLFSGFVCRRPNWTPNTPLGDSSAFWYSTRFLMS